MFNIAKSSLVAGLLATVTAFGGASAAETRLPLHPCTPELQHLMQEWDETGFRDFQMPSKPGQAIVHDGKGHAYTAAAVNYMAYQVRQAIEDCQHGDVAAVQKRVALVSDALHGQS